MVGAFSVSLWKDVPYSAAILFVAARVVDLVEARQRGDRVAVRSLLITIAGWLTLATLLRQNGVILAAFLLLILAVVLPGMRARAVLGLVGVVVVLVGAKFVVYPLAGVEPTPAQAKINTQLHDIAWIFRHDPGAFSKDDRHLLASVAPLDAWRHATDQYGCYNANWEFDSAFHWKRLEGNAGRWSSLWFHLLTSHPWSVVSNRFCAGAIAWNTRAVGPQFTVNHDISPNEFGLVTTPLSGWLNRKGVAVLDHLDEFGNELWAWRAPRWIYLADLAVVVAAIRRRRALLLLVALPMLAQQLSVIAASTAQDARYMMASLVLAWMLLPVAVARSRIAEVVQPLDLLMPTSQGAQDETGGEEEERQQLQCGRQHG
jgi:hypothetical protein